MSNVIRNAATASGLALVLSTAAFGQAGPPAPSLLEDIRGCTLEGDAVFIVAGKDASATRRYKYPWDASVDALCNANGFAIGTPARAAAAPVAFSDRSAATAAQTPPPLAAPQASDAGGAPREFPPESVPLSAEALTRKIAGKVFATQIHNGPRVRLEYKTSGYLFLNVAGGNNNSGPWRAEESRICTQMRLAAASCNEVREHGPRLYLKRDNGEIIALNPT